MSIVRRLAKTFPYILIHPESNGYSYKIVWQHPDTRMSEIIGSSHKTFRTKQSCVSTIKKLKDFWGGMSDFKYAYDQHGKQVDTEIRVEVKRFF